MAATPTLVAAWHLSGCADSGEPGKGPRGAALGKSGVYDALVCVEKPSAYVFGAAAAAPSAALTSAGFELKALPLDRSPVELHGVIVLPAFASEEAEYAKYMERFGVDLHNFVDGANVLVQLVQAKAREAVPPFLPTTHAARRGDARVQSARIVDAEHPLIAGFETQDGALVFRASDLGLDAFDSQDGFDVILADETGRYPLLMEGAYGQGRLILSTMAFDYKGGSGARLTETFCKNLFGHVRNVCARTTAALEITTANPKDAFTKGSQFLAVMPDTQVYSLRLPGLLMAQTSWIREHASELDIRYALQLGDITNNNTPIEWERAAAAFELLDGVVPYVTVPGNHDYGPSGDASNRETKLNDYFSFATRAAAPGFGGAYQDGKLDNTYHLFSIGGREVILLALEWGPRDEVIDWANTIMETYPDRQGILATHAYLNNNNLRYDHRDKSHSQRFNPHEYKTPGVNDGEELWQKLVRHHRFIMTLNGHVIGDGCGYLASTTDRGNTCHQMLSNYQMRAQGGEGYMRLLEFLPDGQRLRVFTYSALYDKFLDESDQNFSLSLD